MLVAGSRMVTMLQKLPLISWPSTALSLEWSRLRKVGMSSVWALANQESSHVGASGVGVAIVRGSPPLPLLPPPCFSVALGCILLVGNARVMHLTVVFGYQGADKDSEQLDFTLTRFWKLRSANLRLLVGVSV